MQERKLRSDPKNPLMITQRPDLYFAYDMTLVRRAYWLYRANDYQYIPTPDEVANIDEQWEQDILRYGQWVQFHESKSKVDG